MRPLWCGAFLNGPLLGCAGSLDGLLEDSIKRDRWRRGRGQRGDASHRGGGCRGESGDDRDPGSESSRVGWRGLPPWVAVAAGRVATLSTKVAAVAGRVARTATLGRRAHG
jgi:hypothetical protein